MKKLLSTLVAASALVVGAGSLATAADLLATGDIPFAFRAGDASLPAGKYDVLRQSATSNVLILRDNAVNKSVMVSFKTRLSPRASGNAELVFDKDAGGLYLTEVYVPAADGYFVEGARGPHTHESVKLAPGGKS